MALVPGTQLGAYEIIAPLGSGGMGEVYRARDTRLHRDVAIKVLPAHLSNDKEALSRFEREASTVAAMSHPNILAVYDIGVHEGITFLVMELLEGENLRTRLMTGALPWRKALEFGIALAEGLSAAHAKGIVHRDLKPDNIFITHEGLIKILDFGLARWRPIRTHPSSEVTIGLETERGMVMGTVGYMSPEQVQGQEADAHSDIFSLGCVLYEMVTGRRAFSRPTFAQTMTAILEQEPPEVSASSKLVPFELSRIIAHCMEKRPHDRFQSARDLAFALKTISTTSSAYRALSVRRSNKSIDSIAVLPFENANRDPNFEYLCDGMTETVINSLALLPKLRVVPRSVVFRFKGRDIDPAAIGRELNVRALLMGRVVQRGDMLNVQTELVDVQAESQLWGEQYNRPMADIFAVQEEIANQISEKLKIRLTGAQKKRLARRSTQNPEAYQFYLKGRYHWNQRTPERLKKALENFQQAADADPNYALAYSGMAECYALFCTFSVLPPGETCPRAREAAMTALSIDGKLAEPHVSLGYVRAFYDWDWAGAEAEFLQGIALRPTYTTAHHWYGLSLTAMGRSEEALASVRRALDLDPLSAAIGTAYGYSFYYSRRYDEAIEQCRKVLEMDPNYGIAFYYMGLSFVQKELYAAAIEALQKAVHLLDGNPTAAAGLGHAYGVAGHREEALRALEAQQELARRRYVAPLDIAWIYAGLGDIEQTFAWWEKAAEDRSAWLPWLMVEPRSDPYRSDPRFIALIERLHLGDGREFNA